VTTPPATPGTKVKPVITVNSASAEVTYGTTVSTAFTVTAGGQAWARKPVQVCVAEGGAGFSCIGTTTSDAGTVRVNRVAKAYFRVVVTATATPASEAVTSSPVGYRVWATATLAKNSFGQVQATLVGANGRATEIQQLVNGAWRAVGAYTAPVSPMKVTLSGLRPGQTYRVVVPDSATVMGVTSASIIA
jgi:serine protease